MTNPNEPNIQGDHIELPVNGMSCGGCAQTVQQALFALDGVIAARVNHADGKAQIHFEPSRVSVTQLQEAIRKAGYQAGEPIATGNSASGCNGQTSSGCCCAKK